MNRSNLLAIALAIFASSVIAVASPAMADHVAKHKPHATETGKKVGPVIRHPQRVEVFKKSGPVIRHPHGDRLVWKRPAPRAGHYWHRGNWFVRVHGPRFLFPRGWHYRVFAVGAILPPIFLASDYYYDDYAALGLQVPPPGYRWVRYGDDLLLVNLRTGEVEDVVYDVFE